MSVKEMRLQRSFSQWLVWFPVPLEQKQATTLKYLKYAVLTSSDMMGYRCTSFSLLTLSYSQPAKVSTQGTWIQHIAHNSAFTSLLSSHWLVASVNKNAIHSMRTLRTTTLKRQSHAMGIVCLENRNNKKNITTLPQEILSQAFGAKKRQ